MELPDFFEQVPRLRVQDPLARVLGTARDGVLEYGYADVVRLSGHSCPTVASAYWLTFLALERLYRGALPQRGGIRVDFRDDARSGSIGVMATVVQMLTGAAGNSGFKGLGESRFARAGLMRYRPDLLLAMRFTRLDTRAAVDAGVDLLHVPADPRVDPLMARVAAGRATVHDERQLAELWQRRVRSLLLDFGRDPAVFVLKPVRQVPAPAGATLAAHLH